MRTDKSVVTLTFYIVNAEYSLKMRKKENFAAYRFYPVRLFKLAKNLVNWVIYDFKDRICWQTVIS